MLKKFEIESDIARAKTLPAEVYRNKDYYSIQKEKVFAPSWQFITRKSECLKHNIYPFTFLNQSINEPLVLTREHGNEWHCLSNVCTHRGNLLISEPQSHKILRCGYHGRQFKLDGSFSFMPEFEGCQSFPCQDDNLPELELEEWKDFLFTSLDPMCTFQEWLGPMLDKLNWIPFDEFVFSSEDSREYVIDVNWMLYCDNYLEGFHIPYVHPDLAKAIDYKQYRTEILPYGVLQIGIGAEGELCLELPEGHQDFHQNIAAYYYWFFPNIMFNVYPWGLSMNIVEPLSHHQTRIRYLTYIGEESHRFKGAGGDVAQVELEDQMIVSMVQKGIQSRLYQRGRYSPKREKGVHHFHRLLSQKMFE